jgi:nucleoid-associated protein YgaU
MGLIDFVKDAGDKLFKRGQYSEEATNQAKQEALVNHVRGLELQVEDFQVTFDDGIATLRGTTPSQKEKEKIILAVGNTEGVAQVDDQLSVEVPEPEAVLYTVKSGDSLSKIAKAHYGDAMKYPEIFEANKPMLTDPNKIYPGQVLRIPPLG